MDRQVRYLRSNLGVNVNARFNTNTREVVFDDVGEQTEIEFIESIFEAEEIPDVSISDELIQELFSNPDFLVRSTLELRANIQRFLNLFLNNEVRIQLVKDFFSLFVFDLRKQGRETDPNLNSKQMSENRDYMISAYNHILYNEQLADALMPLLLNKFISYSLPHWVYDKSTGAMFMQDQMIKAVLCCRNVQVDPAFLVLMHDLKFYGLDGTPILNRCFRKAVESIEPMTDPELFSGVTAEEIQRKTSFKVGVLRLTATERHLLTRSDLVIDRSDEDLNPPEIAKLVDKLTKPEIETIEDYRDKAASILKTLGYEVAGVTYRRGAITTVQVETKLINALKIIADARKNSMSLPDISYFNSVILANELKISRLKETLLTSKYLAEKTKIMSLIQELLEQSRTEEPIVTQVLENFLDSVTVMSGHNLMSLWELMTTLKGFIGEYYLCLCNNLTWKPEINKQLISEVISDWVNVSEVFKYHTKCMEVKPDDCEIRLVEGMRHLIIYEFGWVTDTESKNKMDTDKWEKTCKILEVAEIETFLICQQINNNAETWISAAHGLDLANRPLFATARAKLRQIFRVLTEKDQDASSFFIEGIRASKLRGVKAVKEKTSSISLHSYEKMINFCAEEAQKFDEKLPLSDLVKLEGTFAQLKSEDRLIPEEWLDDIANLVIAKSKAQPGLEIIDSETAKKVLKNWRIEERKMNTNSTFYPVFDCICQLPAAESGKTDFSIERAMHKDFPITEILNKYLSVTTSGTSSNMIQNKAWNGCRKLVSILESHNRKTSYFLTKSGKIGINKCHNWSAMVTSIAGLGPELKTKLKTKNFETGYEACLEVLSEKVNETDKETLKSLGLEKHKEEPVWSQRLTECIKKLDPLWSKTQNERFETLDARRQSSKEKREMKGCITPKSEDSEKSVWDFINWMQSKTTKLSLMEMPQHLFANEMIKKIEELCPVYNVAGEYLKSFITDSSKYKGFRYTLLAVELGEAMLDIFCSNSPSGKLFVKHLKVSDFNLVVNIPHGERTDSTTATCVLERKGAKFLKTACNQPCESDISHKFYMTKRHSMCYAGSLSMILSYGMLIHQYEKMHFDKERTDKMMEMLWSWVVLFCLNNNREMNVMTQNYRYIAMTFLGEFTNPKELARKLAAKQRTTFYKMLVKRYKNTLLKWGKWKEENPTTMRDTLKPGYAGSITYPSPFFDCVTSPQTLVTEMYICHLFERTSSNLDRSLELVLGKHVEMQLKHRENYKKEGFFEGGLTKLRNRAEFLDYMSWYMDNYKPGMCVMPAVHDGGVLLRNWLSSVQRERRTTALNVGLSTITNTNSTLSKSEFSINWKKAVNAAKKQKIIKTTLNCIDKTQLKTRAAITSASHQVKEYFKNLTAPEMSLVQTTLESRMKTARSDVTFKSLQIMDLSMLSNDGASKCDFIHFIKKVGKIIPEESFGPTISTLQRGESKSRDKSLTLILTAQWLEFKVYLESRLNSVEMSTSDLAQCIEELKKLDIEAAVETLLSLRRKRSDRPWLNIDQLMLESVDKIVSFTSLYSWRVVQIYCMILLSIISGKSGVSLENDVANLELTLIKRFINLPELTMRLLFLNIDSEICSGFSLKSVLMSLGAVVDDTMMKNTGGQIMMHVVKSVGLEMPTNYLTLSCIGAVQVMRDKPVGKQMRLKTSADVWEIQKSTRTKVVIAIAEMMIRESSKNTEFQTSLQVLAEKFCVEPRRRLLGMATKAQFGGQRELWILDLRDKICYKMANEICRTESRLIESFNLTETLSHPEAVYYKTEDVVSTLSNTKMFEEEISESSVSANKDHSKWASSSCALTDVRHSLFPLYSHIGNCWRIVDLIMCINGTSSTEIPSPVVIKTAADPDYEPDDPVQKFVRENIKGGEIAIRRIHDWGQGLLHDSGSLSAMAKQMFVQDLMKRIAQKMDIKLSLSTTQGSDDELSSLTIKHQQMKYEESKEKMRDLLNCYNMCKTFTNMTVSPKSTYGFISEYNSRFIIERANTPACIKFVSTQMMNVKCFDLHDLTSSLFSSCQQAMYNGTPYVNLLLLWLTTMSRSHHLAKMLTVPTDLDHDRSKDEETKVDWALDKPLIIPANRFQKGVNAPDDKTNLPFMIGGIWYPTMSSLLSDNLMHIELESVVNLIKSDKKWMGLMSYADGLEKEFTVATTSRRYKNDSIFHFDTIKPRNSDILKVSKRADLLQERLEQKEVSSGNIVLDEVIKEVLSKLTPQSTEVDMSRIHKILNSKNMEYSLADTDEVKMRSFFKNLYNSKYFKPRVEIPDEFGVKNLNYREKVNEITSSNADVGKYSNLIRVTEVTKRSRENMFQAINQAEEQDPVVVSDECIKPFSRNKIINGNDYELLQNEPGLILLSLLTEGFSEFLPSHFKIDYLASDKESMKSIMNTTINKLKLIIEKGESKLEALEVLRTILNVCSLYKARPLNIYGPGHRGQGSSMTLSNMMKYNIVYGISMNTDVYSIEEEEDAYNFNTALEIASIAKQIYSNSAATPFLSVVYKQIIPGTSKTIKSILETELKRRSRFSTTSQSKVLHLMYIYDDQSTLDQIKSRIRSREPKFDVLRKYKYVIFRTIFLNVVCETYQLGAKVYHTVSRFNEKVIRLHLKTVQEKLSTSSSAIFQYDEKLFQIAVNQEDFTAFPSLWSKIIQPRGIMHPFSTSDFTHIDFNENGNTTGFIFEDSSLSEKISTYRPAGTESPVNIVDNKTESSITYKIDLTESDYRVRKLLELESSSDAFAIVSDTLGVDMSKERKRIKSRSEALRNSKEWEICYSRIVWKRRVSIQSWRIFYGWKTSFNWGIPSQLFLIFDDSDPELTTDLDSFTQTDKLNDQIKSILELAHSEEDFSRKRSLYTAAKSLMEDKPQSVEPEITSRLYDKLEKLELEEELSAYDIMPDSENVQVIENWISFFNSGGLKSERIRIVSIPQIKFHLKFPGLSTWYYNVLSIGLRRQCLGMTNCYLNLLNLTASLESHVAEFVKSSEKSDFISDTMSTLSTLSNESDIEDDAEEYQDEEEEDDDEDELVDFGDLSLDNIIANTADIVDSGNFDFTDYTLQRLISQNDNLPVSLALIVRSQELFKYLSESLIDNRLINCSNWIIQASIVANIEDDEIEFDVEINPDIMSTKFKTIIHELVRNGQATALFKKKSKKFAEVSITGSFDYKTSIEILTKLDQLR